MDVLTCDIGTEIYKIKFITFGCSSVSKLKQYVPTY